jgi:hypothetical protein
MGSTHMERRIVKAALTGWMERDERQIRKFGAGTVLNVLQWVRPGLSRFTVEGEGAETWCCPEIAFLQQTDAVWPGGQTTHMKTSS